MDLQHNKIPSRITPNRLINTVVAVSIVDRFSSSYLKKKIVPAYNRKHPELPLERLKMNNRRQDGEDQFFYANRLFRVLFKRDIIAFNIVSGYPRDKHGNSVTVQTDVLKFGVTHTPKRSNFWHCDIVLTGKDGKTGGHFVVKELNRPELDSKGKVAKKTAALIALLEDSICLEDSVKTKKVDWEAFSTVPIGRKAKKQFNGL